MNYGKELVVKETDGEDITELISATFSSTPAAILESR